MKAATLSERPGSITAIGSDLSCPPSRLAEISSRPHTATNAPTPFESEPPEVTHSRPSSASFGSSRGDAFVSTPFSGALNPPVVFPRPHSATADIQGRSCSNASLPEQHFSTVEVAPSVSTDRPETAMLLDRPGTAEMLPPRRELPFQRLSSPRSSGSDTGRSSDGPLTGKMGPPALPRSVMQRPGSSRSARSKDVELPHLPQPTVINRIDGGKQQPPRAPNQDQSLFQRAKTSPANRLENEPPFSALPSSLLTFKKSGPPVSTSLQDHSVPGSKLQGSMLEHRHHPPAMTGASYQISNAPVATIGTDDADRLAAFMMQTDEERRAALNEFIFRHLENENFLTLVEDMETAWARVALGMR